ncbi:hypothetical protein SLEP1_g57139 [Rubroshorea leprosula]|uniref:Sesquiterpene synthase n=1 Tax=Rubroshorea leprosula TaxID=152421 RepID=A0AAV5MKC4_9ROSI|nr:hypothetical protein SLEP1_g57139 [Rubroshorea leprosula]
MLKDGNSDQSKKLHLINTVQFLGVDYHFEEEIEDALQKIYDDGDVDYDLSTVALWFRLLRQQGIKAPSEVFKKFVDKKGKFKADLVNNVTATGPEELKIFEKCIERWDIGVIDQLPNYMKLAYQALLDLYSAIEGDVAKEGRQYAAHYGKESMKQLAKSYLVEAKWREEGCVPSYEEYMHNGLISSGIPLVIAAWERVMNDVASHQFERQRDHHASAVECYMKQHCVSKEEAVESLKREIVDAWKVINKEGMIPTIFPTPLITRIVNMTRTLDLLNKDDDAYTRSYLLKDQIASLFVDPILV